MEFELVHKTMAEVRPAGNGRDEPNAFPFLQVDFHVPTLHLDDISGILWPQWHLWMMPSSSGWRDAQKIYAIDRS